MIILIPILILILILIHSGEEVAGEFVTDAATGKRLFRRTVLVYLYDDVTYTSILV